MIDKINIASIVSDHLKTLNRAQDDKPLISDYILFFVLPGLAGLLWFVKGLKFTEGATGIVISALSIFAGFLINVLVLLYTVNPYGDEKRKSDQEKLIKHVNANLLFAILIALIGTISLCAAGFFKDHLQGLFSSLSVFCIVNFSLTLLMALKRLQVLLSIRFMK